jgi:CBS domain-containing protein
MRLSDFVVDYNATILQTASQIQKNMNRSVIVLRNNRVIGVVSEGDILRALLQGMDIHTPINEFMDFSFKYLTKKDYAEAYNLFKKFLFSLLPIVNENFQLQDVITLKDILEWLEQKK